MASATTLAPDTERRDQPEDTRGRISKTFQPSALAISFTACDLTVDADVPANVVLDVFVGKTA